MENDDRNSADTEGAGPPPSAAPGLQAVGVAASVATLGTGLGTACVGGVCSLGPAAAVGGAGGALTGLKAALAAAVGAAGGMAALGWGGVPPLDAMVAAAVPLDAAAASGQPMVLEFYRPACGQCREVAGRLLPLETAAAPVQWVMLNTDDVRWAPVWEYYGVDELPHFEFLDGAHREVARAHGVVRAEDIAAALDVLKGGVA